MDDYHDRIDHVSVPKFDAGAMENWGLILYREEYLSYNKYTIDTNRLEFIVAVISHELAHMVGIATVCLDFNDYNES